LSKEPQVDPEFRDLLPQLTAEEFAGLEAQILADGEIRESGLFWTDPATKINLVIDGHNRREIAKRHNKKMYWDEKKFDDRQAVIQWIVDHQLGRRNLTDQQRAYFIGREYLAAKKASSFKNNRDGPRTSEKIAARHGINERTVRRAGEFAEAVDAKAETEGAHVKTDILAGKGESMTKVVQTRPVPTSKRKPRRKRPGSMAYDWRKVNTAIGQIARCIPDIKKAYPESTGTEYQAAHRMMNEVTKLFQSWQKKLTKSQGD